MPIENIPQDLSQEPQSEPGGHDERDTPPAKPNGNGHAAKGVPGSAAALGLDLNVGIMALTAVNPDGYQHLASINPLGGAPSGRIFAPGQWREKREWIEAEQDAGNNVYYTVGEPHPPGTGKTRVDEPHPSRSQIAKIREVFVDCDISKSIPGTDAAKTQDARDKINVALKAVASGLFYTAVPGIIADSGNGGHAHIILPEVLDATPETIEKAERAGKGLQNYFQKRLGPDIVKADSTWEVCRLARIPGTVNFPNATKLKEGRVVVASKLLQPMTYRTATLDKILADFPMAQGSGGRSRGSGSSGSQFDQEVAALIKEIDLDVLAALGGQYAQLPEELRKKFDEALKTDGVLDDLWKNGGFGDGSGSDQVYALAKGLIRGKGKTFSIMDFGRLVWVWDHADGGKGVTRPDSQGNGDPRSLARCWAKALAERAERVFNDDVDVENDPEIEEEARKANEAAASVASGRSQPRWKEWDGLLAELEAAREETKANHADTEVYGSGTPDFGTEKDEPFVTSRHARGEVSMLVAPPSRGKTLLVLTTAISIVLEKPEMLSDDYRHDVTEVTDWAGDVVLVLNESAGRAQAMLAAAEAVHGYKKNELKHEVHIYPRHLVLAEMGPHGVMPTPAGLAFLRWLIGKRKKAQIALVVFDTFASTTSGLPENSVDAMQPVMDMLDAIAKAGYCAVEAIHHVAKSGSNIDAYQGRGSGATGAAVAAMSSLNRKNEDDKTRLVLSCLKTRNRKDFDDVEFKVVSHSRQVERARAPGNFRTASIAVLKRMTAIEVVTENSEREEQDLLDGAYALDIAERAGTTIRPGGAKKSGTMKGGGSWKSAWSIIYDTHNGVPGGRKSPMSANGARALVARLEARGVLKKVPAGEGDMFELVPGWEQLLSQKGEDF